MERDGTFAILSPKAFLINLAVTAVLLGLTLWSGRRGRRPLHYACACLTLLTLAAAIVQAEILGRGYRFEPLRLRVHLTCAFAALLTIPWVAITGWRLRTRPSVRRSHQRAVTAFVVLTAVAILTAGWMFLNAQARA